MRSLISIDELKSSTVINKNVDDKYLLTAIETAQTIKLQQLIGSKLLYRLIDCVGDNGTWLGTADEYTLVTEYIQPYLKREVVSDIIVPLNYKVRNEGILQANQENMYLPTRADAMFVKEHYENEASFFATRLTNYIKLNIDKFPLYSECDNEIKANPQAKNTVIYLGK